MTKRLAYFGPAGTFTEAAAVRYDVHAQRLPFTSIAAVAAAVEAGMADEGVVPIENSLEGSVTDTLDLLIHESELLICHEIVIPIELCLLVSHGDSIEDVSIVYSHPQALGQCRRFIERCFPKAQVVASLSTAAAVEDMLRSDIPSAAIAPSRAAEIYGAMILAQGIQDNQVNFTRYVVLSHQDHEPTGSDKTSVCFSFGEDKPGIFYSVLGEFANRELNLVKVESRPSKESLGRYIFLVDLEGHRNDQLVKEALSALDASSDMMKIFGSYPKHSDG